MLTNVLTISKWFKI